MMPTMAAILKNQNLEKKKVHSLTLHTAFPQHTNSLLHTDECLRNKPKVVFSGITHRYLPNGGGVQMQSVAPGAEKLSATGQAGAKGLLYKELLLQTEHGSAAGPRRGESCTVQLAEGKRETQ